MYIYNIKIKKYMIDSEKINEKYNKIISNLTLNNDEKCYALALQEAVNKNGLNLRIMLQKHIALLTEIVNEIPLDFDEYKQLIDNEIANYPSTWREGQKVFNAIDSLFNVARKTQFEKGVDCFYDDNNIDDFISTSYEIYSESFFNE